MAGFDSHRWCSSCRDKGVGQDVCVLGETDCQACSVLTPEQREQISRRPYRERKAKKLTLLSAAGSGDDSGDEGSVASSMPSATRSRKRDRSVDSGRSKKSRRSRSPEPQRESDRVRMDRFEATLSLLKDTLLKMEARDAAKTFTQVSTEVIGGSQVRVSDQPFFRPDRPEVDDRGDQPVTARPAGAGKKIRPIPSAAAGSADQLAGFCVEDDSPSRAGDGDGAGSRVGSGAGSRDGSRPRAGDGSRDGARSRTGDGSGDGTRAGDGARSRVGDGSRDGTRTRVGSRDDGSRDGTRTRDGSRDGTRTRAGVGSREGAGYGAGFGSSSIPYYADEQLTDDAAGSRDSSPAGRESYPASRHPPRKSGSRRTSSGLQLPDDREPDFYLLQDPERLVRLQDLRRFPLEAVAKARPIYLDGDQVAPQADESTPHRPTSAQQHRPRYQQVSECGDQERDHEQEHSRTSTVHDPWSHLSPQQLAALQNYREHMRGLRHLMGWTHIPDATPVSVPVSGNPFRDSGSSEVLSLDMPLDPWLHDKLKAVNRIVARGYPQKGKQSTPLPLNKLVRPPAPEPFYGLHDASASASGASSADSPPLPYWGQDSALLNSSFDRISRRARMSPNPNSAPIPWETLRAWETQARRGSYICNQAACFARGLTKLQGKVEEHLKTLSEARDGEVASSTFSSTVRDMAGDFAFMRALTDHLSAAVAHMGESVLVNLANTTLMRRDAALGALRFGARPDTVASMRAAPIQEDLLFPETFIRQAESEMREYDTAQARDRDRRSRAPQARAYQPKPKFSQSHSQGASGSTNGGGNSGTSGNNKSFKKRDFKKKSQTQFKKGSKGDKGAKFSK